MDPHQQTRLLAEYQANLEMWKHDDSLRQQRNANFLTVNTILLVAIGAVLGLESSPSYVHAVTLPCAVFGLIVSCVWYAVQARNAQYVRFRRSQIRSIESRLEDMTTFQNTYTAFTEGNPIVFAGTSEGFKVASWGRFSSTKVEGLLPLLIAVVWLGVAGWSIVALIV